MPGKMRRICATCRRWKPTNRVVGACLVVGWKDLLLSKQNELISRYGHKENIPVPLETFWSDVCMQWKSINPSSKTEGKLRVVLVREYLIECAICGDDDKASYQTYVKAEAHFRALGWSKHRDYGWTCPKCNKKYNNKGSE